MKTYARAGLASVVACGALLAAVGLTHNGDDDGPDNSTPPKGPYAALRALENAD